MHLLALLVFVGIFYFCLLLKTTALDLIIGLTIGLAIDNAESINGDVIIDFFKRSL